MHRAENSYKCEVCSPRFTDRTTYCGSICIMSSDVKSEFIEYKGTFNDPEVDNKHSIKHIQLKKQHLTFVHTHIH